MAAAPVCRSCLRVLRHQLRQSYPETRQFSRLTNSVPSPVLPSRLVSRPSSLLPLSYTVNKSYGTTTSNGTPPPTNNPTLEDEPTSARAAKAMSQESADFTETYVANSVTETLFKECARQADYVVPQAFESNAEVPKNAAGEDVGQGTGWWYENIGLEPTFATWAQVTMLHMYLLTVRLRYFPPSYSGIWMQHLHDHFFYEAEHRMTIFHQLSSRMIRNKYLKDLYDQWRGVLGAYDEGLIRGDAVLAAAVWRNVFKAKDDVDWTKVALVVGFMRRGLRALDRANDKIIVGGMIKFGNPMSEAAGVEKASEEMDMPFTKEDEDAMERFLQEVKAAKKS